MSLPKPSNGYKWYHATRFVGVSMLAYGLLIDKTPERGSIIVGGIGLIGLEKVARDEESGKKPTTTGRRRRRAMEGNEDQDSSNGD